MVIHGPCHSFNVFDRFVCELSMAERLFCFFSVLLVAPVHLCVFLLKPWKFCQLDQCCEDNLNSWMRMMERNEPQTSNYFKTASCCKLWGSTWNKETEDVGTTGKNKLDRHNFGRILSDLDLNMTQHIQQTACVYLYNNSTNIGPTIANYGFPADVRTLLTSANSPKGEEALVSAVSLARLDTGWLVITIEDLVGGLEHFLFFHTLGMSSSQLLLAPSFFRGVGLNHQPVIEGQSSHGSWTVLKSKSSAWLKT